jgi:hypothetical protein
MSARKYYPTIAGSFVAVVAACAFAQAPAPSTTTPAPAATGSAEQQPAAQASAPAKMHHAKKHKAMHSTRSGESMAGAGDAQYRTALRHCAEGQASQRDQCLDDAISRYGHS